MFNKDLKSTEDIIIIDSTFQNEINNFISYLKKDKYKNKIEELKIECRFIISKADFIKLSLKEDNEIDKINQINIDLSEVEIKEKYLQLILIKIKKSQQKKGYGYAVMSDIINFSDKNNIKIKLWASDVFGVDKRALIEFYKKLGFTLTHKHGYMQYIPNNKILEL